MVGVVVVVVIIVVVVVAVVVEVRVDKLIKLISVCFRDVYVKKGLKPLIFDIFDFEICFALQRRALFRHFFDI